jgi:hypothetical protein
MIDLAKLLPYLALAAALFLAREKGIRWLAIGAIAVSILEILVIWRLVRLDLGSVGTGVLLGGGLSAIGALAYSKAGGKPAIALAAGLIALGALQVLRPIDVVR